MTEPTKARLSPVVYILGFVVSVGGTVGVIYCVYCLVRSVAIVILPDTVIISTLALVGICAGGVYIIGCLCRKYYIETWDSAIGRLGPVALKNFICVFQDLYDARKRPAADATPDEIRVWNEREYAKKEEA